MKHLVIENKKELDREILTLISESDIREDFDSSADYKFVAKYKDKIVGIIAYRVVLNGGGKRYPRFVHIIFHKDFKRSKIAYAFARETERLLLRDGFSQAMAYIRTEKAEMMDLAKKFGYKQYAEDDGGKFFYKDLGG